MSDHKRLLEAALFISSKPLMLDDLAKVLNVNSLGYVKELLQKLQKDYENKAIELFKTPEGWQFQVKPKYLPQVSGLTPYSDISEGAKRTLAVIAYKEPIRQSEIIRLQGNKAYSYIKSLLKMNLINAKKTSRTKILSLTQEFERYFGEERKRIKEMMDAQVDRMQRQAETKAQRASEAAAEEPEAEIGEEESKPRPEKYSDGAKPAKPGNTRPPKKEKATKKKTGKKADSKPRKSASRKVTVRAAGDTDVEKTAQPIEELVL